MPKPTPPEIVELVRKLAGEGKTSTEIGEVIGKHPKQVQQMYRRHNIACLPRGGRKGNRHNARTHYFDDRKAASLYEQGMTYQEIADHFGIDSPKPSEVVRRRLQRIGVKSRIGCAPGKRNPGYKHGNAKRNEAERNRYECYRVTVAFLGTLLPSGWVVHHIDENPQNNSPANLALFPSARCHNLFHQQLLSRQLAGTSTAAIRLLLENDGHLLQSQTGRKTGGPDRALLSLLRREAMKHGYRTRWKHLANPEYRPRVALPA